jgi:hypothetical protein
MGPSLPLSVRHSDGSRYDNPSAFGPLPPQSRSLLEISKWPKNRLIGQVIAAGLTHYGFLDERIIFEALTEPGFVIGVSESRLSLNVGL